MSRLLNWQHLLAVMGRFSLLLWFSLLLTCSDVQLKLQVHSACLGYQDRVEDP